MQTSDYIRGNSACVCDDRGYVDGSTTVNVKVFFGCFEYLYVVKRLDVHKSKHKRVCLWYSNHSVRTNFRFNLEILALLSILFFQTEERRKEMSLAAIHFI